MVTSIISWGGMTVSREGEDVRLACQRVGFTMSQVAWMYHRIPIVSSQRLVCISFIKIF